ncbi:hypothetical protein NEFER03_0332 [Nematocida sp. LUAm3]|nr:hypothetical protein NEFER03_0332 [Nematocida sp. LUAm3]KAI5173784.1 hypothetical protein NEFER02_0300 [Nematocida sp. LUAm2]KAI5177007.1 hypothetical protein NEFER01_0332 [Nematocida sp. LUAm1]
MNRYVILILLKTVYSITAIDPDLCSNDLLYCYDEKTGSITKTGTTEEPGHNPLSMGLPGILQGGDSVPGVKTYPYRCKVKGVVTQTKDLNLLKTEIPVEQDNQVLSPISSSFPATSILSAAPYKNSLSFSSAPTVASNEYPIANGMVNTHPGVSTPQSMGNHVSTPVSTPVANLLANAITSGAPSMANNTCPSTGSNVSAFGQNNMGNTINASGTGSMMVSNLPMQPNTQIITSLPNTTPPTQAPSSMYVPSSGSISYVKGPPRIVPGEEEPKVSVSNDKICFTRPIQKYVHVQCCKNSIIPIKQKEPEQVPCLCPWHPGSSTGQSPYTVSGRMNPSGTEASAKLEKLLIEDINQLLKVKQLL